MQIPSGQINPSPAFLKAIGSEQSPGIAQSPDRSTQRAQQADPVPQVQAASVAQRNEAPRAAEASPQGSSSEERRGPPPRGSFVDISV